METATQEPQTAASFSGSGGNAGGGNHGSPTEHRQPTGSQTASLWLVVIVVLIGAGIWLWVADRGQETTIPGVSGIQGEVTSIDNKNTSFVLEKKKLLEDNDGIFTFEENTYTVLWTQDTRFFVFDKITSVEKDFTTRADETVLKTDTNVIVTPRERAGNVITATEVRILPGSTRAQVVE